MTEDREFNAVRALAGFDFNTPGARRLTLDELFIRAFKRLQNKDIKGFSKDIIDLHILMPCNCFLRKQDQSIFKQMNDIIATYEDNKDDFDLNVANLFIGIWNDKRFIDLNKYYRWGRSKNEIINEVYLLRGCHIGSVKLASENLKLEVSSKNYYMLANAYVSGKYFRYDEAIDCYNKAIEIDPKFVCAHFRKALLLLKLQQTEEAIQEFENCSELVIEHWQYVNFLTELYSKELYQEALIYAKKGCIAYPEEKAYQYLIGLTYLKLQNHTDAITHFYSQESFEDLLEVKLGYWGEGLNAKIIRAIKSLINIYYGKMMYREVIHLTDCAQYLFGIKYFYKTSLTSELKIRDEAIDLTKESKLYQELANRLDRENKKIKFYNESNQMSFGKFKGLTVGQIAIDEPDYIHWCLINIDHFAISGYLFFKFVGLRQGSLYYEAIEIYLIKSSISKNIFELEKSRKEDDMDDDFDSKENHREGFYFMTEGNSGSYEDYYGDDHNR